MDVLADGWAASASIGLLRVTMTCLGRRRRRSGTEARHVRRGLRDARRRSRAHYRQATMERESYLRSLPYLYPSTWPAPLAARAYGGSYIRKLMFSGHVVSIELSSTSSCQPGTLGPAFFLTNDETVAADTSSTDGGTPAIDNDPALCPFEVSVLVPKSIAGVSPGASSASTAFASSQSPVGTTPVSYTHLTLPTKA